MFQQGSDDSRRFLTPTSWRFALYSCDAERAFVYWNMAKLVEGQGGVPSVGTCRWLNARQAYEAFVELIAPFGRTTMLWYVPQISNGEHARGWADVEIVEGVLMPQV